MSSQTPFRFRVSTNLRFGIGESEKLGEEAKALGFSRLAAVVDAAVAQHPQVLKALGSVKSAGLHLDVFACTQAEPSYDYLESFKENFIGKTPECLIGIGGGSAMDLTKGIAVLLTNDGPAISFRGFPQLKKRPLPVIAIPTTAGTGSEVTFNAVFTDTKENRKLGINTLLNFPVCAIVDPMMTLNCPKPVTVSSGVDALVHTMESYVHRDHTPISRMFSCQAFRLLFNALGKILDRPQDIQLRADLALGAYYAATALMNAGSGPSGALSYPLGATYKVPHGYAGGVFLPSVTRMNVEKGYQDYAQLYDLIEEVDVALPVREKNTEFAKRMQELMADLGVPRNLSHYKLGPKDIEFMIAQYEPLKAAIAQNPIEITKSDVSTMLHALA